MAKVKHPFIVQKDNKRVLAAAYVRKTAKVPSATGKVSPSDGPTFYNQKSSYKKAPFLQNNSIF